MEDQQLWLPGGYKYTFNYVFLGENAQIVRDDTIKADKLIGCHQLTDKYDMYIECNGDFIMSENSLIEHTNKNRSCKNNYVGMKLRIDCKGDFVMLGSINADGYMREICYGSDGGDIHVNIENQNSKCQFNPKQMTARGGNQIVGYTGSCCYRYRRARRGSISIIKCGTTIHTVS